MLTGNDIAPDELAEKILEESDDLMLSIAAKMIP